MNVICYVDGFNLYHGLRSRHGKKYYWLDLWMLASRFLLPGQVLQKLVYCTSRIKDDPAGEQRQSTYIDALLATHPQMIAVMGHYLSKEMTCRQCQASFKKYEEKMTDVNIACHLLEDAMDQQFDVALLISADSDLVPPVSLVKRRWPQKKMIVLFPPGRQSHQLRLVASGYKNISEADLRQCQLPSVVNSPQGRTYFRPAEWR